VLTEEEAREIVARDPRSSEVIHPYLIGRELQGNAQPQRFVIDIPSADAVAAARWPGALDHIRQNILPTRRQAAEDEQGENLERLAANPRAQLRRHHEGFLNRWWQQSFRRGEMIAALQPLSRYIALSRVAVESRPSIYVFVSPAIRPGDALQVFAFDDDYSFGVLASCFHRRWFQERCSTMRVDLRYTSRRVFETFPWPQAPTENAVTAVASVVEELLAFRAEQLGAGLTLGTQYQTFADPGANALRDLHERLDDAVRTAYGFDADENDLLQLLALNDSMAAEEADGITLPRGPGCTGLPGAYRTDAMIEADLRLLGG
jgi:MmeI, target recognition domain